MGNDKPAKANPQVLMGNDKPFSLAVPLVTGRNDSRLCHYPITENFVGFDG